MAKKACIKWLFLYSMVIEVRFASGRREARLSVMDAQPNYYYTNIDGQPGTYAFGYDVEDQATGNRQFRSEQRYSNGTVVGSYGHMDSFGKPHIYEYVADEKGYRVKSKKSPKPPLSSQYNGIFSELKEPSVTWSRKKKPLNKKQPTATQKTQQKLYKSDRKYSLNSYFNY